jgi:type VI secretion system ImpH/TssG family protein
MAAYGRRTAASVEELMFGAPGRIDVFQLVRLLRMRDRTEAGAHARRQGFAAHLRFRADLSARFPGEEVTRCQPVMGAPEPSGAPGAFAASAAGDGRDTVEIGTPNYCVASELGPLPEPFLEWVRDRLRDDDGTFAAFLDVFNHRLHVLRHRLKAGQEFALDDALPQHTRQAHFLASIAGIASRGADAQIMLPRRAWLGIAATLADTRRSGAGALLALRRYLGVPAAQLEPLVGSWRKLLPVDRPLLGVRATTLGRDAVLGTHIWNQCAGVRLTVPDVDYPRLCALLPPRRQSGASPQDDTAAPGVDEGAAMSKGGASANASAGAGANGSVSASANASAGVGASGSVGASPGAGANAPADAGADGYGKQDAKLDAAAAPVDGYAGLAQMVRLLFDRRVDCHVTLTIRTRDLPPPMLTARVDQPLPGWPATATQRADDAADASNAAGANAANADAAGTNVTDTNAANTNAANTNAANTNAANTNAANTNAANTNATNPAPADRYAGLRLGQTAWLGTPRNTPDDERRAVMFTIIGDPQGVPA